MYNCNALCCCSNLCAVTHQDDNVQCLVWKKVYVLVGSAAILPCAQACKHAASAAVYTKTQAYTGMCFTVESWMRQS